MKSKDEMHGIERQGRAAVRCLLEQLASLRLEPRCVSISPDVQRFGLELLNLT